MHELGLLDPTVGLIETGEWSIIGGGKYYFLGLQHRTNLNLSYSLSFHRLAFLFSCHKGPQLVQSLSCQAALTSTSLFHTRLLHSLTYVPPIFELLDLI